MPMHSEPLSGQRPGEVVPAAEAVVNADGEVVLFVPPLARQPLSWSEVEGGMVRLRLPTGPGVMFGCPPEVIEVARARRRILVAEVDREAGPLREGWVALEAPAGSTGY